MGLVQTSLHEQVKKNKVQAVRKILKHANVDIDQIKVGQTALFLAVCDSNVHVVRELLNHGANVNVTCSVDQSFSGRAKLFSWTALHQACRLGNIEMVDLLLRHGGDVDVAGHDGIRPIHVAAWHGHTSILQLLIKSGCNVNQLDNFNESAIVLPITRGDARTVEILLLANCKLNSRTWSSRSIRVRSDIYFSGYQEISDITGFEGPNTLFTHAITCGWIHLAIMLLRHGFNCNKYEIKDILRISSHSGLEEDQVRTLVDAMFCAGFMLKSSDLKSLYEGSYYTRYVKKYDDIIEHLKSCGSAVLQLKQRACNAIREHLRLQNVGKSIFTKIEELPIPCLLKSILKLESCTVDYSNSETEDYPFYFHIHKRKIRAHKHPYLEFWLNSCCLFSH